MGYEAGNLELSILGFSEKAVASIDVTAKALRRLASAVDKINNTQFVYAGDKLEVIFSKIAKATNSINTTNITNLASAAKSLSSISRLSNLDKMDFAKVGKGFETLSVAIQPFLDKVRAAEASLTALDGILKRTSGKKIQGLLGGGATENKSGGFLGFAKLGVNLYMMRRLGRFVGQLVQAGSDYTETLNLWQVAMRGNLEYADQFVSKMQKAYGISTKTLMEGQAVYKNMLGSLGQISDETATKISESLVMMTADYASLYNRSIQSAFQNMQSMLAGQVRPIRSAGLDITETTLYQYYQQIGGTKAMRQLTRTEKQLLSILAVYKQMGSAGALGDMAKTIDQYANQSRMLVENARELKTWTGLILKDLVDRSGVLPTLNAILITITGIIKASAKPRGIGNENFLTGMLETADATNDEIDKLQGKLLDFDKFRSLEGAETNVLGIDEKLLEALSSYSSNLDDVQSKAQQLAKPFLDFFVDDSGELTKEGKAIVYIFKLLVKYVGILIGLKLGGWLISVASSLGKVGKASTALLLVFSTVILAFSEFFRLIEEKEYMLAAIAGILGVALAGAFIKLAGTIIGGDISLGTFYSTAGLALSGIILLVAGIKDFISSFDQLAKGAKVWIPIIAGLVGVIVALAAGLKFMEGNWLGAIGLGAAVAGAGILVSTELAKVPRHANGASDIDSGTLFVAGEMGKTEAVYTGSNGKTNVANVRQMEQAFYNALSRYSREGNGTIVVQAVLDGEVVYENTTSRARARGQTWAKA